MLCKLFAVELILLQLLTAPLPAAQRLAELKLAPESVELLDGRLRIRIPAEGQNLPVQRSIMAAPEAEAEETRVMIDAGPQRMVVMAYELFARTDNDFEAAVRKLALQFPMKVRVEPFAVAPPLRAYAYYPAVETRQEDANLILGLYVAQSDGTVQHLVFYVNPSGSQDFKGAASLATSIAKTLSAGTGQLDTKPGDRQLSAYSSTLLVTVPEGFVVSEQPGPDFVVHHIRKITPLGSPALSIGVYLGDHPADRAPGSVKKGGGLLFGKTATWYERTVSDGGAKSILASAVVPLGPSLFGYALPRFNRDLPSYADVFLQAPDPSGIDELKKIAATLRIGPPRAMQ